MRSGRLVFRGLSFALGAGEALVLRGPNGSGKSSLLRLLAGFVRPAAGELSFDGTPIAADLTAHRARLAYVGHADAIKGVLTLRENLAFALALSGAPRAALDGALERFDLVPLADSPARFLSAGQRRRLALARLIGSARPLWLLDEPAVGLDAANRARLQGSLAEHRASGGIAVLATHGDIDVPAPQVLELGG